jgi:fumarate hydratase class I
LVDLTIPIEAEQIASLNLLDVVRLSGILVTARDAAHKFLVETFIEPGEPPEEERELYGRLSDLFRGGVIYHCGPVVARTDGKWRFVSAGPTTSIREEPYEHRVIGHFGVRAIIGKGGMGPKTLEANRRHKAVYLHAVGGAGTLIADSVTEVVDVLKPEFGTPEALWVVRVENFPAVVTMDAHGNSLHARVADESRKKLEELLALGS